MLFNGQTISVGLDTDANISGYTGSIRYKKPNQVEGEWAGSVVNDIVTYTIVPGDIDVTGVWEVQAKAVSGAVVKWGKITVIEFRSHL